MKFRNLCNRLITSDAHSTYFVLCNWKLPKFEGGVPAYQTSLCNDQWTTWVSNNHFVRSLYPLQTFSNENISFQLTSVLLPLSSTHVEAKFQHLRVVPAALHIANFTPLLQLKQKHCERNISLSKLSFLCSAYQESKIPGKWIFTHARIY